MNILFPFLTFKYVIADNEEMLQIILVEPPGCWKL